MCWTASAVSGTADAGFHTIVLHPIFDARLSPLNFKYDSLFGEIKSSWTVKGTTVDWNVTLPANTTGRLQLKPTEAKRYKLDGAALSESPTAKQVDGGFELPAGQYHFEVEGIGSRQ